MLRLIPIHLHRAALVAAHRVRLAWWRIRRPRLAGCRVLAFDSRGQILLVRHSYGSRRWMLPGGGIGAREEPVAAALREFAEEVGCGLTHARQFGLVEEPLSGATNRVHLVCGLVEGTPRPDRREIVAVDWFDPYTLPPETATAVRQSMGDWIRAAKAALSRPPEVR